MVFASSLFFQTVSLLEALDTSGGIDHLLGSSEEGVTSRANVELETLCSGLGLDHVATGAADFNQFIAGVYSVFHFSSSEMCSAGCTHRKTSVLHLVPSMRRAEGIPVLIERQERLIILCLRFCQ